MIAIFKPRAARIYINSKRKTIALKETGCTHIINGGLFEWSWKACPWLRVEGKNIASANYTAWGYGFDDNGVITMTNQPEKYQNFISCVDLINPWDGVVKKILYQSDMGGARPRTAIGQLKDGRILLYCDKTGITPEALQDVLEDMGCVTAMMLDGGGSTQCIFPGGKVTSERPERQGTAHPAHPCGEMQGRIVHNLLCLWEDESGGGRSEEERHIRHTPAGGCRGESEEENMSEIDVQYTTKSDGWNNGTLTPKGIMVHSTATPGVGAQEFRDRFNRSGVGASVHYFLDDKKIIQCLPTNKKAGHCGTGRSGKSGNSTHISFEICEPKGIKYGGGSTIVSYNPPKGYFEAVWDRAVWLCAKLCKDYGFDPLDDDVLLCHSEGYRKGIATNHGDVEHWFKKENRTMDGFRLAVYAAMHGGEEDEDEMSYERFKEYMNKYLSEASDEAPSGWAKESCEKSVEKGVFKGDGKGNYNWHKPIDRESVAAIMDRMGLL